MADSVADSYGPAPATDTADLDAADTVTNSSIRPADPVAADPDSPVSGEPANHRHFAAPARTSHSNTCETRTHPYTNTGKAGSHTHAGPLSSSIALRNPHARPGRSRLNYGGQGQ